MYYIGIDLGGTNIAAGIVDSEFKIVKKGSVPTGADRDADAIITDMAALCARLIKESGITVDDIAYAGIASPGTVKPDTGYIEYANNLPFLNYPIAAKLSEMLGVKKVYIENDANAAAKAEAMAGAAKGSKYSVMITLGTGVGGGVILDGKVYSGFNYAGAELGHIVIEKGGRKCTCGRYGCWETYSSSTGLINTTKQKIEECRRTGRETLMEKMISGDLDHVSGKTAFSAMKQGDEVGSEVVDEYIEYLVCGLSNIINIFQPDILSLGGGICNEGAYLLKPIEEKIWKQVYTKNREPKTVIKIAELGNDAGIVGAATLGV